MDIRTEHSERGRSFGLKYWMMGLLAKNEMTGAMIIDAISKKSSGYWKPSPGSIYPMLAVGLASGFLKVRVQKGKKYYSMTAKGNKHLGLIKVPKSMFSTQAEREDSVGENVETIGYSVNYLVDNIELLKKDKKNFRKARALIKQLESAM